MFILEKKVYSKVMIGVTCAERFYLVKGYTCTCIAKLYTKQSKPRGNLDPLYSTAWRQ